MKISILTLALTLTYATAGLAAFPAGDYKGHGRWKDSSGNNGTYTVTTISTASSLENTYIYGTETKTFKMNVGSDNNGFFDVLIGGEKVGTGSCMSVQCHYTVTNANLEESIVFWDGHLYRVGSKIVNGTKIGWEEDLQPISK